MDTSVIRNDDLKGFSFTTANDIETRTLPTLSELASDLFFRFTQCDQYAECCRVDTARGIDDVTAGCTATTLASYCSWKYEPFGEARVAQCATANPPVDKQVLAAERDWLDVLDRNYRHHEKARNMKTANKDLQVDYTYANMNMLEEFGIQEERDCSNSNRCSCDATGETLTPNIGETECKKRCLSNVDCNFVYCEANPLSTFFETGNDFQDAIIGLAADIGGFDDTVLICDCHEYETCDTLRTPLGGASIGGNLRTARR
jgi:hypothetical protein